MLWIFNENDYLGKTISELEDLVNYKGIAIFDLDIQSSGLGSSNHGTVIWEHILMRDFIKEFPEYKDAKVERCNDFYGSIVLRIRK